MEVEVRSKVVGAQPLIRLLLVFVIDLLTHNTCVYDIRCPKSIPLALLG